MEIMIKALLLSLLWSGCCFAYKNPSEETDEGFLLDLIWKCTRSDDLGNCLKIKAVKLLDILVRTNDPLVINEYLTLAKNPKISSYSNYQGLNASETTSEGKSSNTEEEKSENLDKQIWEKLVSLFTTRTVQLNLSSDAFEGRGKDKIFKKGHGVFLMATMMGGMMMKMALGKIALIAGKALIIGKIALVLSIIIALRRFAINGGDRGAEVVYTSAENAVGRKFNSEIAGISDEDGGDLAYSAYKPNIYKNL